MKKLDGELKTAIGIIHSGIGATTSVAALLAFAQVNPCLAQQPTQTQIPADLNDFFEPGTQEGALMEELYPASACSVCHEFEWDGNEKDIVAPHDNWVMSMMAQSARDPVWHAALAIANQDVAFGGDTCIRCHSPNAWLGGRSVPTDASGFEPYTDFDGVSCNFCHRMVDPVFSKENPAEDESILAALAKEGLLPTQPGNGRYIVDPVDVRRGPLDDVPANYHGVPILVSPFHSEGHFCGTCHDVSNAIYTRTNDGTYVLNDAYTPHRTGSSHDMMPEQRTYSEWLNSTFASTGVYFPDNRFGGDHPTGVMQSCQDCHMPKVGGGLCGFWESPPFFWRPDNAQHGFVGANTWVIGAVHELYGQNESGVGPHHVDVNRARTEQMLRNASDMQLVQLGNQLKVRIINFSGHKLPTGYPEGRRMWINVQFYDSLGNLIDERGQYDLEQAVLNTSNTKVYEMKLGMDEAIAAMTGLPSGQSFHLLLNNFIVKDNRIPPMGFTNAAFEAVRAPVVNHSYADGQYWDDTMYAIPKGAAQALVVLYYQTTSKEYIEFLRDANVTNNAGQVAYDLWVSRGKSAPVDMDALLLDLAPPRLGDVDHNGVVNVDDLLIVISGWGPCPPPGICDSDANGDGVTNVDDLLLVISNWG